MLPVLTGATLVVVGYGRANILTVLIVRFFVCPSEGARYYHDSVLGWLVGHKE
jgi:hypothetical protein